MTKWGLSQQLYKESPEAWRIWWAENWDKPELCSEPGCELAAIINAKDGPKCDRHRP